jgi:hypothetical protein
VIRTNSGARPAEIKLLAYILKLMDRKEYLLNEIGSESTTMAEPLLSLQCCGYYLNVAIPVFAQPRCLNSDIKQTSSEQNLLKKTTVNNNLLKATVASAPNTQDNQVERGESKKEREKGGASTFMFSVLTMRRCIFMQTAADIQMESNSDESNSVPRESTSGHFLLLCVPLFVRGSGQQAM